MGDNIRMRLPGDKSWSMGHCRCILGNRSYEVEVNGERYQRNRRQLRSIAEWSTIQTARGTKLSNEQDDNPEVQAPELQHVEAAALVQDQQIRLMPRRSSRNKLVPNWQVDYEL